MYAPDRSTTRTVVNKLVDMLITEGVNKEDILDELDLSDSEIEYYDLNWMKGDE